MKKNKRTISIFNQPGMADGRYLIERDFSHPWSKFTNLILSDGEDIYHARVLTSSIDVYITYKEIETKS